MSNQAADGAHCELPSTPASADPVVADTLRDACPEQPRLQRSVGNTSIDRWFAQEVGSEVPPVSMACADFAKSGMTTELLRSAAAALEAALLGGNASNDHACQLSVAESHDLEAVFNSCPEMRAGYIPASAANSLLERLGYSGRGLSIVETSLAQAEDAGANLDLREFSRLALLLRDSDKVQASGVSPLFGSPAKALRRSRSQAGLARESAGSKPMGRVASLRSPLEPLHQRHRCASRGSGRRHLKRCSSACHFDLMLAPASVQLISQPLLC